MAASPSREGFVIRVCAEPGMACGRTYTDEEERRR
jgi:hypothetical protein